MADYKLVYLKYRGRAELIRFIFAHAGVKYEDHREEPEKWAELRPGCESFSLQPASYKEKMYFINRNAVWYPSLLGDRGRCKDH